MGNLHQEMVADLVEINNDLGQPSFTWQSNDYKCIASLTQFNRDLVEGGFVVELMLTLTVARYDTTNNAIFPGDIIPQAQQKLTFNGRQFRIENVKQDSVFDYSSDGSATSTGARIRIVAIGITRGL